MQRTWSLPCFSGRSKHLVETFGLSPVVAEILYQRGRTSLTEVLEFLRPTLFTLPSPFCFPYMHVAVERLQRAFEHGEKILVYGDYDVDGVTSVTLLYRVLVDLGFQAVAYIPHRLEEGYGLHREPIEKANKAGVKVIITVDCGISANAEIDFAKELGIDVILTDHHEPPSILPNALAIINPKVGGYPFRELAGVGVAFKLAQALLSRLKYEKSELYPEREILDLVALGTIADVVPLVGENRVLVKEGLKQMENTVHVGLAALLKECGLENKTLKAGQIAFMVAPRINAAGRMDSARAGLELLLTGDPDKAEERARRLSKENQVRQETEKRILTEAVKELEQGPLPRVIVLSSPGWHHGVIGIVASRLVERYYRPVFLIAEDGDEAKGSARGIPGYHVLEQLTGQAHLIRKFGGHRQAAGFSLRSADISLLRDELNRVAGNFPEELFHESVRIDNEVKLDEINENLVAELEQLAPFGAGNPSPTLASFALKVAALNSVGQDKNHLKFRFGENGEWEGMAYRQGSRVNEFLGQKILDAAFTLEINTFQGQRKLQFILSDIQIQAKYQYRNNQTEHPQDIPRFDELNGQVAATLSYEYSSTTEWLDWRVVDRAAWLEKVQGKKVLIWSESGLVPLENFVSNRKDSGNQENIFEQNWELGIIHRLPQSEEDFIDGLRIFNNLNIKKVALSEFNQENLNYHDLGYWHREELVEIYQALRALAKVKNPFIWGRENTRKALLETYKERIYSNHEPRTSNHEFRSALKIFEELGFLRCLGGTNPWQIEFLPVEGKMDLGNSLRYRSAGIRWECYQKFRQALLSEPIEYLKEKWINQL